MSAAGHSCPCRGAGHRGVAWVGTAPRPSREVSEWSPQRPCLWSRSIKDGTPGAVGLHSGGLEEPGGVCGQVSSGRRCQGWGEGSAGGAVGLRSRSEWQAGLVVCEWACLSIICSICLSLIYVSSICLYISPIYLSNLSIYHLSTICLCVIYVSPIYIYIICLHMI